MVVTDQQLRELHFCRSFHRHPMRDPMLLPSTSRFSQKQHYSKNNKNRNTKKQKSIRIIFNFCCCNIMQIVLVCEIFYMEEEEERGSQIGNGEVFRVEATRKRERERKVRNLRHDE